MNPLVSIIIPAYNAEKFIRETISSAQKQTYPHIEIIIVDDGSTDSTYSIVKELASKTLKVFRQPNLGASTARNNGFAESKGSYIQYLDADDLLSKTKIENQVSSINEYGDNFIYSGKWKLFFQDVDEGNFLINDLWKDFSDPVDWLVMAWTQQIWMHPSAWLTPRHLIKKAGPWNESLSLHDDGEFFSRVILQSSGVHFCKEAESYYRKGVANSLSSIYSEKAITSHFKICQLYENHLMERKNCLETRRACAYNYLFFYYAYFPRYVELRKKAKQAAARLGFAKGSPQGTELFFFLKKLFGWKIARIIEQNYYRNGLNRASIVAKFKKIYG